MNRTTKRALTASALAMGLITAATTASAAIAPGSDSATKRTSGIAATRHNLGTSNRSASGLTTGVVGGARDGDLFTTGTDEICVFCHTPHGSDAAFTGAPIWNKALPVATNYTVYSSGTMQGTSNMTGAPSLACLSCHDGTQAMDNMINSPGGSGYVAGGARGGDTQTSLGAPIPGTWSNLVDTNAGRMQSGAGVVMLGTDLSNDHPVGIPYGGGGCTATGCADPDFVVPHASQNGGLAVGPTTSPAKANMRVYGTAASLNGTVECASCHDPHNDVNKTFLRIPNTGSAVCLTCHAK